MSGNRVSVRAFGIAQGIVLVVIVVSIFVFRRRHKGLTENAGTNFNSMNVHAAIRRATAGRTLPRTEPGPRLTEPAEEANAEANSESRGEAAKKPAPALESALPTWSKQTLPHEILGIAPDSSPTQVEAAFKKLLKKYHPDRFGGAGKGYQKRAHHVVLLLQEARDKMLPRKH